MRVSLIISAIILSTILSAQVPQAFKYQAVARDSSGTLLANKNINLRITIIDSAAGGINAYSEVHKAGTNNFGLFSINIGEGITPTGQFTNIPWSTGNKWIKIEFDPAGGTNYIDMGTSPLLSVPYALYAGNGGGGNGWELIGNTATNPSVNFIGTTDTADLLIKTNNTSRIKVLSTGNVEVGINPFSNQARLTIVQPGFSTVGWSLFSDSLTCCGHMYAKQNANNDYTLGIGTEGESILRINPGHGNPALGDTSRTVFESGVDSIPTFLEVRGDVQIGRISSTNISTYPQFGNKLHFLGGPDTHFGSENTDPLWMGRYNVSPDKSELRVNIGDNCDPNDAFVIQSGGVGGCSANTVRFKFTASGNAYISNGIILRTPNGTDCYELTIDNNGDWVKNAITCPN